MRTGEPFRSRMRRWLRPPRTLRPTREGWWYLASVMAAGVAARPVRGLGAELHDLRPFRVGDDPRLIHWKQSAKLDRPMVKELESEEGGRVLLVLEDPARPPRDAGEIERLEQAISFVASLAAHLLHGAGVIELRHRGSRPASYRGEVGLYRLLEFLARYTPPIEGREDGTLDGRGVESGEETGITIWLGRGLAVIPGPRGEGGRLVRAASSGQEMRK